MFDSNQIFKFGFQLEINNKTAKLSHCVPPFSRVTVKNRKNCPKLSDFGANN